MGFDAGDQTNFFNLASSNTPDVVEIETQSNVGVAGRYMFRTDLPVIVATTVAQSVAGTGLLYFTCLLNL